MDDFKAPNEQNTGTPPGKKILKTMEAARGNFYLLKAKMSDVVPRISGRTGDFVDLNGENAGAIDPKEAIWQKIRKPNGAASDRSKEASESTSAKKASETPGAKLAVLKQDFESKMRQQRKESLQKRYEMWKSEGGHRRKHKEETNDDLDVSNEVLEKAGIDELHQEDTDDGAQSGRLSSTFRDEISNETETALAENSRKVFSEEIATKEQGTGSDSEIDDDKEKDSVSPIKADYRSPYKKAQFNDSRGITDRPTKVHYPLSIQSPTMFNHSRSMDDLFYVPGQMTRDRSPMPDSPNKSQMEIDNISATRKLLGRVISEEDSQPPTSQDILAMCSGQFITDNSCSNGHLNEPTDFERKVAPSTPAIAKAPRPFYEIFQSTPRRVVNHFTSSSEKSTATPNGPAQDRIEKDEPENLDDNEDGVSLNVEKQPKDILRKKRNRLLSESEDDADADESDNDVSEAEDNGNNSEQESASEDHECEEGSFGDEEEAANGADAGGEIDEEEMYLRLERERREFFDNEAELSGSDDGVGDDNEDENKDEWEPEAGDLDEMPSEGELRNQIGRVHWKQMMDEDKRQLLRYKEAYLRDGDSEAQAINFRFRWKRNGEDDDDDFDGNDAPEGEIAVQDDEELDEGWQESLRQRAKWFTKHGIPVEDVLADVDDATKGSQLFSAARAALHRTASASNGASSDQSNAQPSIAQGFSMLHHSVSVDSGPASIFFRRESLLKRGSSLLEKLVGEGGNSAVTTGRSKTASVFTVLSPKKDRIMEEDEPAAKKRASKDESQVPEIKKRKVFGGNIASIFQTFD